MSIHLGEALIAAELITGLGGKPPAALKADELKLTGEILADIYAGKITKWNDPKLVEMNRDVKLPANAHVQPLMLPVDFVTAHASCIDHRSA